MKYEYRLIEGGFHLIKDGEVVLVQTIDPQTGKPLTSEEAEIMAQQFVAEYQAVADAAEKEAWLNGVVRPQRNKLLDECDLVYCNAERWELMTEEEKQMWRQYKQALKDLPKTIDINNPIWPKRPGGQEHEETKSHLLDIE